MSEADSLARLAKITAQIAENEAVVERLLIERRELATRLTAQGVTLQRIADACGVTRQRVHQWAQS